MAIWTLVLWTAKRLVVLTMSALVLWEVAKKAGPLRTEVVVHVVEPGVDVTIDSEAYRIESLWEGPIVCELPPGNHVLQMSRSGRILYKEDFFLMPGKELVLTAWDPERLRQRELSHPVVSHGPVSPEHHAAKPKVRPR